MKQTSRAVVFFMANIPLVLSAQEMDIAKNIQAAQIARNEYQKRLESRVAKEGGTEIGRYVLNIDNYDIGISENDKEFVIYISLRKNKMGLLSTGGTYWVDKKTLQVENSVGFK